ncbi:MAG: response regulator [Pseudomonadota bacterium]
MLSGIKVLLAEDNPTNQLVATHMLENLGAGVVLTDNGVDAIEAARRDSFDVLLVDIQMPGMSGEQVIREVRERPGPNAAVPIIALTAYVGPVERDAMARCGADGVISKPILSIEGFGDEIRQIMERRKPPAAERHANGAEGAAGGLLPELADHPVFDAGALASFAGLAGLGRVAALIDQARSDLAEEAETLASAIERRDQKAVDGSTHKICGMAGAVGAMRLDCLARALNTRAPGPCDMRYSAVVRTVWDDTDKALATWAAESSRQA